MQIREMEDKQEFGNYEKFRELIAKYDDDFKLILACRYNDEELAIQLLENKVCPNVLTHNAYCGDESLELTSDVFLEFLVGEEKFNEIRTKTEAYYKEHNKEYLSQDGYYHCEYRDAAWEADGISRFSHDGITSVTACIYSGNFNLFKLIVEKYGGDLDLSPNQSEGTCYPIDYAFRCGRWEFLEYLIQYDHFYTDFNPETCLVNWRNFPNDPDYDPKTLKYVGFIDCFRSRLAAMIPGAIVTLDSVAYELPTTNQLLTYKRLLDTNMTNEKTLIVEYFTCKMEEQDVDVDTLIQIINYSNLLLLDIFDTAIDNFLSNPERTEEETKFLEDMSSLMLSNPFYKKIYDKLH